LCPHDLEGSPLIGNAQPDGCAQFNDRTVIAIGQILNLPMSSPFVPVGISLVLIVASSLKANELATRAEVQEMLVVIPIAPHHDG